MGNVNKGGDLIQGREPADGYSTVEGADLPMNSGVNGQFVGSYTPGDLGVDATNRAGSCDGTSSDSMFDKMPRSNDGGGSSFPDGVSGEGLSGTGSDPVFETCHEAADDNDTRG